MRAVNLSAGVVVTVAGAVGVSGTADGPFESARFVGAEGMTMDPAGRVLYVVDALPVNQYAAPHIHPHTRAHMHDYADILTRLYTRI